MSRDYVNTTYEISKKKKYKNHSKKFAPNLSDPCLSNSIMQSNYTCHQFKNNTANKQ